MSKDSILVDDAIVEISAIGRQVYTADGKKPAGAGADGDRLMPRQASRGRGRVGLAGARGSRGRPGLGARPLVVPASAGTPVAAATPAAPVASGSGGGRSQDDFRALLTKKT